MTEKIAHTPEINALFRELRLMCRCEKCWSRRADSLAKLEKLGMNMEQAKVLFKDWSAEMRARFVTGPFPSDETATSTSTS
jgi:hypothetical protein